MKPAISFDTEKLIEKFGQHLGRKEIDQAIIDALRYENNTNIRTPRRLGATSSIVAVATALAFTVTYTRQVIIVKDMKQVRRTFDMIEKLLVDCDMKKHIIGKCKEFISIHDKDMNKWGTIYVSSADDMEEFGQLLKCDALYIDFPDILPERVVVELVREANTLHYLTTVLVGCPLAEVKHRYLGLKLRRRDLFMGEYKSFAQTISFENDDVVDAIRAIYSV